MRNKTLLTKYAKDRGCVVLPKLIDGKVCIYNESTGLYTLHAVTRYADVKDDFNPDDYCVLHDWQDSLGFSTHSMRTDYKVELAYADYMNNQRHNILNNML